MDEADVSPVGVGLDVRCADSDQGELVEYRNFETLPDSQRVAPRGITALTAERTLYKAPGTTIGVPLVTPSRPALATDSTLDHMYSGNFGSKPLEFEML